MLKQKVQLTYFLIIILSFDLTGQSLLKQHNSSFEKYFTIRDTNYTLSNHIIEVVLPEQKIYLHFRDGKILEFKCSTGDERLEKGVSTPEGIFVIKNKARKVYSAQFDSTLMLNWMGFNFNIGFHSLEGRSYYKHLGKLVSSHGCIRISREDSEYLYRIIEIGTPVFIHSGKSARIVAFAEKEEQFKLYFSKRLNSILNQNQKYLFNGLYINKRIPITISSENLTHKGIDLGNEDLIPVQLPPYFSHRNFYIPRNLFDVITINRD